MQESTALIERSERLAGEYDELLGRAQRLLTEQRALVKKFRREHRKTRR